MSHPQKRCMALGIPLLGMIFYDQDGFWQWVYHITAAIICYLMAIKCQGTGHVMMHQLPRLPWMLAYMLHPQRAGDDSPDVSTEKLALTPDCEACSNVFPKSYSTVLFQ